MKIETISKIKNYFFKDIDKIDKLLARLMRKKRRNT